MASIEILKASAASSIISAATQRSAHTGTQSADTLTNGTNNKLFSSAEQAKLAAISGTNTGDQDLSGLVTKTTTVNGKALSTNISITAVDVGLSNVTDTSDANKPVSIAQAAAIASAKSFALAMAFSH